MVFERSGALKTIVAIALLCASAIANAAPGVRAQVDRTTVSVGESFKLSIILEDVVTGSPPALPAIPGVNVAGLIPRQEVYTINGQRSQKQIFDYQLVPTQAGDLAIPAIAMQAGGQIFTTAPIAVKVLAQGAGASATTNLALLQLIVPKKEVYLSEAFPVEIRLYWHAAYQIHDVRLPQLKAAGFSTGQFGEPQQTSTILNGVQFNVAIFRTAVIPARTGDLVLGPAECQFALAPRPRSVFEGFLGRGAPATSMAVQTEAHPIRVLPLPTENVPETFNGAVGTYSLAVSAGPTNLVGGDPITVRVQISGRGQLDALKLPDQPQWREFRAYPPNSSVSPTEPLGLAGSKNFEQVIVTENHEIRALPPFEFSFFDPAAKAYRTLKGPAFPLAIRPSISAAAPPPITNTTAEAPRPPVDDIIHIGARFEPIAMVHPPLVRQPWFLGLQVVPVVAWLGLFIARKRKENLANNPRLRRQREVAGRVREGLRELPQLAAARRTEDFFATVFRLFQEQLGAQLDMPASGITEAVIEQKLEDRNLPASTLAELRELFQACNQARYAPERTSEELSSYIPRVQNVLRDLEHITV